MQEHIVQTDTDTQFLAANEQVSNKNVSSSRKRSIQNVATPAVIEHIKMKRKLRKNTREKQRRSELNDKFDELATVLHLGKSKAEKLNILSEAIHLIQQLQIENNDLKMEKQELRMELAKLTFCLQQAFPSISMASSSTQLGDKEELPAPSDAMGHISHVPETNYDYHDKIPQQQLPKHFLLKQSNTLEAPASLRFTAIATSNAPAIPITARSPFVINSVQDEDFFQ